MTKPVDTGCSTVIADLVSMFRVPEDKIRQLLETPRQPPRWSSVLDTITPENPADIESIAALLHAGKADPEAFNSVIARAGEIKNSVFGNSIKLFVPVYISNVCVNDCKYCAYRSSNSDMPRRTLSENEFRVEMRTVTGMGYRVIELVTGESSELQQPGMLPRYIAITREILDKAQSADDPSELILMSWALSEIEFSLARDAGLDAFYLWQETYDETKYSDAHPGNTPKADFQWRVGVFDRAIKSGIDKLGLGVLFGLAPWEFDVLALISHGRYLERTYNISPQVIGLPRFKHADGAPMIVAPYPVTDDQLRLAVALYRLAFPQSHVFLNTREKFPLILQLLEGGGSEMNIACAVFPGGYTEPTKERQFDYFNYPTEKTLASLLEKGYRPTHYAFPQKLHI